MTDKNDADVDRALATFGGATMKYLNFASPLLKRTARTPAAAAKTVSTEASYDVLFKRAAATPVEVTPEAASSPCEPIASAQDVPVATIVLDEPAPELTADLCATVADRADERVEPMQPVAIHAPLPLAAIDPAPQTMATATTEPVQPIPAADAVCVASTPSAATSVAPSTSLADHLMRTSGAAADGALESGTVATGPAQAGVEVVDRRTVAEMFRILTGKSERLGRPVEAVAWRDSEQSLFRRI